MAEIIDDAAVSLYKAEMTAAWEEYMAIQRAYHNAYVAWQICAMEYKYVDVPRSENGKPASTLQRMMYGLPFRQRLEKAELVMELAEKAANNARFRYESERIKISKKYDDDLLQMAILLEEKRR